LIKPESTSIRREYTDDELKNKIFEISDRYETQLALARIIIRHQLECRRQGRDDTAQDSKVIGGGR